MKNSSFIKLKLRTEEWEILKILYLQNEKIPLGILYFVWKEMGKIKFNFNTSIKLLSGWWSSGLIMLSDRNKFYGVL